VIIVIVSGGGGGSSRDSENFITSKHRMQKIDIFEFRCFLFHCRYHLLIVTFYAQEVGTGHPSSAVSTCALYSKGPWFDSWPRGWLS
jgi:hypothetical protein